MAENLKRSVLENEVIASLAVDKEAYNVKEEKLYGTLTVLIREGIKMIEIRDASKEALDKLKKITSIMLKSGLPLHSEPLESGVDDLVGLLAEIKWLKEVNLNARKIDEEDYWWLKCVEIVYE